MAEVRLAFSGQWRRPGSSYAFVVRAGGARVGHGFGGNQGGNRVESALTALERGLEFVLTSPLAHRPIVAQTDDREAVDAALGGSGRRELDDLIAQADRLRFERASPAENREASVLAEFGLRRFERLGRAFEICDDVAAGHETDPGPLGAQPFFSLPFDPGFFRLLLDRLPAREREIIRLRYGVDGPGPLRLSELGALYGVSRSRVQQIAARAMERLWTLALRHEAQG